MERSTGGGTATLTAVATLRGLLRKVKMAAAGGAGGDGGGGGDEGAGATSGGGGRGRPVDDDSQDPVPAVGFRPRAHAAKLQVMVLGARHLPARLPGLGAPAAGYIVKVKLFPGAAKFETEQQAESWPVFNESFSFPLAANRAGSFLMLTVYAVDELKRRKAIGAVTWPLDSLQTHQHQTTTPDIWRRLHDVRGAVLPTNPQQAQLKKEARRNQVEVTLSVAPGGIGEPDCLVLTLLRLRWSLQSTREYEQKKAQLFMKLSVLEGSGGAPIKARKTRPFAPNIAVHFTSDGEEASVSAPLPPPGPRREALVCQVALCTRPNRIAKKVVLGRAIFGTTELSEAGDDTAPGHVAKALQSPGKSFTQWHSLL